jgi:hypothetical protein
MVPLEMEERGNYGIFGQMINMEQKAAAAEFKLRSRDVSLSHAFCCL